MTMVLMHCCDTISVNSPQTQGLSDRRVAVLGERRQKLGKIEAIRHNVRKLATTTGRQRTDPGMAEGTRAVISRFAKAALRGFLIMVLIALPSVLLPGVSADTRQMVTLIALFAGALTFVEYNATYPGLIEFRDAPPFNRIRYVMLLCMVVTLSVICSDQAEESSLTRLLQAISLVVGESMDFPYSPTRLLVLMVYEGATPAESGLVRATAGMAYLISLVGMAFFVVILKLVGWPNKHQAFNVWVNLPTFDPTAGGDVVDQLDRDARVNITLGYLLPFLVPTVVKLASGGFEPVMLASAQTMIWTIVAWAFLPASLLMRGIAMGRIADMIRQKRRQNGTNMSAALATV
jgi:hypothetical protein